MQYDKNTHTVILHIIISLDQIYFLFHLKLCTWLKVYWNNINNQIKSCIMATAAVVVLLCCWCMCVRRSR